MSRESEKSRESKYSESHSRSKQIETKPIQSDCHSFLSLRPLHPSRSLLTHLNLLLVLPHPRLTCNSTSRRIRRATSRQIRSRSNRESGSHRLRDPRSPLTTRRRSTFDHIRLCRFRRCIRSRRSEPRVSPFPVSLINFSIDERFRTTEDGSHPVTDELVRKSCDRRVDSSTFRVEVDDFTEFGGFEC